MLSLSVSSIILFLMLNTTPETIAVTPPDLKWDDIDTVFLDMDGTLLDLNYDNTVWNKRVPQAYAMQRSISKDEAQKHLLDHMRQIRGSIEFYSFDYWEDYTGLDLVALHRSESHLVCYRPGALQFLRWLKSCGKLAVIATNAHTDSVRVKDERIAISNEVAGIVSSQQFQVPKEETAYWEDMQSIYPFDPTRSLFIDDNEPVLDSAARYRISHLLTIITPDSQRSGRTNLRYAGFDDFSDIYPGQTVD
ncbi:MAG: HAD hydrolase-like protein [Pseudomonadota bacterium]|nr:HAD hydrolase-like protein [Pseudomonadota bacterium]